MQGDISLMATFKVRLRDMMLKKSVEVGHSLTRTEVAEMTGLSIPTISRWYDGAVERIEAPTVSKLLNFFGCTFSDLVQYEE
jgi:DNA-binding Xre family transcriptional regulator